MKTKKSRRPTLGFFRKGGGEVISLIATLPFILFVMFIILDVIRIGTVRERLEYVAYRAARTAVVQDSYKNAEKESNKVAKLEIEKADLKIDKTWSKWASGKIVEIKYAGKEGIESKAKSGTKKGDKAKEDAWEKGNFITVTVGVRLKALTAFTGFTTKYASITMMIEKLDAEESLPEWFRDMER